MARRLKRAAGRELIMHEELERFIPIANTIAKTFGEHCEVVIYDLSQSRPFVAYAVHNHVTGRQIGQFSDREIKQIVLSHNLVNDYVNERTADYRVNCLNYTADQRKVKSSTALIRNTDKQVIGVLCINFDLKPIETMESFVQSVMRVEEECCSKESKKYANVAEWIDEKIEQVFSEMNSEPLSKEKKVKMVLCMHRMGVFSVKGSVDKVARKLRVTNVTVYSYLDEIKKIVKKNKV